MSKPKERWCQYHRLDHLYPLHCKECGGELPEGLYSQCAPCRAAKVVPPMCPRHKVRHTPKHCVACERPLDNQARSHFCSDCLSWEHVSKIRKEREDQAKLKAKLSAWVEAQKP